MSSLSLVGKINASNGKDERSQYPCTDENARIVLRADDGCDPVSFEVNSVNPVKYSDHKVDGSVLPEFNGGFRASRKMAWTVTVTDSRILFWSPDVVGPFGGVKAGDGTVSAGQMEYSWIEAVSANNDKSYAANAEGLPEVSIRSGNGLWGIDTECYIEADASTLSNLLAELAKRYVAYMKRNAGLDSETVSNLKKLSGFDWGGGKGLAALFLDESPATLETAGAPKFREVGICEQTDANRPEEQHAEEQRREAGPQSSALGAPNPALPVVSPTTGVSSAPAEPVRPSSAAAEPVRPLPASAASVQPSFCPKCGTNLQTAPVAAKFCPKCGIEIQKVQK
jgi:hypothetical protein